MKEQFLACAKRTAKIFDPVEAVLSMKLLSPGCSLVTSRSETKWYISTPERIIRGFKLNLIFF